MSSKPVASNTAHRLFQLSLREQVRMGVDVVRRESLIGTNHHLLCLFEPDLCHVRAWKEGLKSIASNLAWTHF